MTHQLVRGSLSFGGYSYSIYSFFMIAAAILIAAGVYLMLYRTSLGRNIRAAVSDPDLLRASGVDVVRLFTTVFVVGAMLAGLGGVIVAPSQAVGSTMDTDVLVLAFAISVIGGLGSIVGSLVGALIVGELISFGLNNPFTNQFALAFARIRSRIRPCAGGLHLADRPVPHVSLQAVGRTNPSRSVCLSRRSAGA